MAIITQPSWYQNPNSHTWGFEKGLRVAIDPGTYRGPRGLIHIMSPTLDGGRYDLINFFAIEPVVDGRRGFSELEHSALDDRQGLRLSTDRPGGLITALPGSDEQLAIPVQVERFGNGAHVRLVLSFLKSKPDEVTVQVFAEADSAPIQQAIITATMGNKARARILYLKDRPIYSLDLWPNYNDVNFAHSIGYSANRMLIDASGQKMVAVTTNEKDPSLGKPVKGSEGWAYHGVPVTQYWKTVEGIDLSQVEVWVNGRSTYWGNHTPIPGGIAFENFEMRAPFKSGQKWCFGMTRKTPKQLGYAYTVKLD